MPPAVLPIAPAARIVQRTEDQMPITIDGRLCGRKAMNRHLDLR